MPVTAPRAPGDDSGAARVAPEAGAGFFTGYGFSTAITPAPPPRRRRRLTAGLAAATAATALVASLLVVLGGGTDAQAAVLRAVNGTLADRTVHITLDMSASVGDDTLTASGAGSADFTDNAMAIDMSMSAAGQQIALDAVMVGGTIYESLPGISVIEPGKSWVSADLSQFEHSTTGSAGALGVGDDPAATLHLLAQQGGTVTSLGASTVDGYPVQGYAVTIDPSTIDKDLSGASTPSWLRQSLSGIGVNPLRFRVYVDGQGRLRRETLAMGLTVDSQALSLTGSADFSDYGAPVNVTPPPADQVVSLQQFLQDAASAQGAAGALG